MILSDAAKPQRDVGAPFMDARAVSSARLISGKLQRLQL
jgi:hypothetical protein